MEIGRELDDTYMISAIYYITRSNGYWVAVGTRWDSTNYATAMLAYCTTLGGSWTTKDLWHDTVSSGNNNELYYATNINGKWFVAGKYHDGTTHSGRIAYADALSGEWTIKDLWSDSQSNSVKFIKYHNGVYYAGGQHAQNIGSKTYARIAYTTDCFGTWNEMDLVESIGTSYPTICNDLSATDDYVVCVAKYSNGVSSSSVYAVAFDFNTILLPIIDISGAYAYIKAKEDS